MCSVTFEPLIRDAEVWSRASDPESEVGDLSLTSSFRSVANARSSTILEQIETHRVPVLDREPPGGIDEGPSASEEIVLGIPVFAASELRAVVIIYVDWPANARGAMEIWSRDDRDELGLNGAVFSNLSRFAGISRHVRFPRGSGLPGRCWEERDAKLIVGLGKDVNFMRSAGARAGGLEVGLAIPVLETEHDLNSVVCLLSAHSPSMLRGVEMWDVQDTPDTKVCRLRTAAHQSCPTVAQTTRDGMAAASSSITATAANLGIPVATNELQTSDAWRAAELATDDLKFGLAIPVYAGEFLRTVITILT